MDHDFCRWKPDVEEAIEHQREWWRQEGMVLWTGAVPREEKRDEIDVGEAKTPYEYQADPEWIALSERARFSILDFPGDTLPIARTVYDCMTLVPYLGAEPRFAFETIWYDPRTDPPEDYTALAFDPRNRWWQVHKSVYEKSMTVANGDYLVGYPGVGCNIEVLRALRGTEEFLLDLYDRPSWVRERLEEINAAFFEATDTTAHILRDTEGGITNAYFGIYGPGRTSLITLDPLAMISEGMFRDFVAEPLRELCRYCDFTLLHVDGIEALRHVDAILEIEELDAVEWTPCVNKPRGGEPVWYDLYKKILASGKSAQAIDVLPDQVIPLLDAVGSKGMFIWVNWEGKESRDRIEELIEKTDTYR